MAKLLRVTNDTLPSQHATSTYLPVTHVTKIQLDDLLVITYP